MILESKNYFEVQEATVTYVIVYDTYSYGCSQQRMQMQKQFASVEAADAFRIEHYYGMTLIHRSIYSRLSNGGWNEKHYTRRPTEPIDDKPVSDWLESTREEREQRNMEAMKWFQEKRDGRQL